MTAAQIKRQAQVGHVSGSEFEVSHLRCATESRRRSVDRWRRTPVVEKKRREKVGKRLEEKS